MHKIKKQRKIYKQKVIKVKKDNIKGYKGMGLKYRYSLELYILINLIELVIFKK